MATKTAPSLLQPELLRGLKNAVRDARAKLAVRDARTQLAELGGYALLIGVNEYDDDLVSNLRGGRNDVLAYWKICRKLGYKRICALTSPVLGEKDLVRAEMELRPELAKDSGVTESEVRADVRRWLAAGETAETGAATASEIRVGDLEVRVFDQDARRLSDDLIVTVGEPTREAILRGVKWLADRLTMLVRLRWTAGDETRDRWEQWPSFPGFMAYSGHGARGTEGLYLCPRDVRAKGLANAVSFSELRRILDRASDLDGDDPELVAARPGLLAILEKERALPGVRPTDNLTVVLDCCFSGASDLLNKLHQVPTITPGRLSPGQEIHAQPKLGSRVLCASERGQTAYQALLGGEWHGAFSWALTTVLEQWRFVEAERGRFRRTDISHAELLYRTRALLQALSFPQHPVLLDTLANKPVFWHDTEELGGDETACEPPTDRPGIQIDPTGDHGFAYYKIFDLAGALLAEVVANESFTELDPNTEYWQIDSSLTELDTDLIEGLSVERDTTLSTPPVDETNKSFKCAVYPHWASQSLSGKFQVVTTEKGEYGLRLRVWRGETGWSGSVEWFSKTGAQVFTLGAGTTRTDLSAGDYTATYEIIGDAVGRETDVYLQAPNGDELGPYKGYNYAHWDTSPPQKHRLVSKNDTPVVMDGDVLYIQSMQYTSARLSAQTTFRLAYDDHFTAAEEWTVSRVESGAGPIRKGEKVRFLSAQQTNRYLSAESDGELGTRESGDTSSKNLGIDWVIEGA